MKTKRLRYRGHQIACLKKKITKMLLRLEELEKNSRAFKTKAEHGLWLGQFQ